MFDDDDYDDDFYFGKTDNRIISRYNVPGQPQEAHACSSGAPHRLSSLNKNLAGKKITIEKKQEKVQEEVQERNCGT